MDEQAGRLRKIFWKSNKEHEFKRGELHCWLSEAGIP